MKKTKVMSAKRSFFMSVLSLVLCFAMLLGTTWAWFTDSVTSGVNQIKAGNLDIEVSYQPTKDGNWESIKDADSLFDKNALWEPGHTEYVTLKIENKGTLALKYQMNVSPVSETGGINKAGEPFKLSDYLVFATTTASTDEPIYADRAAAREAATGATMKLNQAGLSKSSTLLAKGANDTDYPAEYITLVVYMPEEVGNEANYLTGSTPPQIELGIKVLATQVEAESDSFDNTYDANAFGQMDKTIAYNYFPQVAQSATLKKSDNTVTATGAEVNDVGEVTIKSAVKVKEVTGVDADADKEFASVQLPADTVTALLTDEKDHVIALNVNKDDAANANFKTATDAPDLTDKETTTYEVNVTKDGVKVSNTENLYTVKMFIGENKQNLVMYHNNTEMTKVTDTPDANNEYNYTPADGYVTMCVNSFSPFTSVYDEPVAAIGTKVYYSLESAVAAAKANETVVLLKNVVLDEELTIAADKDFTLNLNGKTIENAATDFDFTTTKNTAGSIPARFMMIVEGKLTICDTGGNGKISADNYSYGTTKAILVKENGAVTVNSGTVYGEYAAFYVVGYTGLTPETSSIIPSLTVNGGTVSGKSLGIGVKGKTATITINEGASVLAEDQYAISTNGTTDWYDGGNCRITVNGGSVKCTKGVGIYNPAESVVSIKGGILEGATALAVKGGNVTIEDGAKLIGTGEKDGPHAVSSGTTNTGDALYIEDTYEHHAPVVTVKGGTFQSANGYAVQYWTNKETDVAKKGSLSITGGTYSSDPAEYVADGYLAKKNDNNTWTVRSYADEGIVASIGGTNYDSFQAAIDAVKSGETIKLHSSVTSGFNGIEQILGKDFTVDMGTPMIQNDYGTWTDGGNIYVIDSATGLRYYGGGKQMAIDGNFKGTDLYIPEGVEELVRMKTACNAPNLTNVYFPATIKKINGREFVNCNKLAKLYYKVGDTYVEGLPQTLTYIGESAFQSCSALAIAIEIPDGIDKVCTGAFYETAITSVTFHSNITGIGQGAFRSCAGLTEVTLPASITSLGNYVFRDCANLLTMKFEFESVPDSFETFSFASVSKLFNNTAKRTILVKNQTVADAMWNKLDSAAKANYTIKDINDATTVYYPAT